MESRGPIVLAVTAPIFAAATLFVFLRLVSRVAIVKRVQMDDYFIFAAWLTSFGLSFAICYAVKFGLGQHQKYVIEEGHLQVLQKLEYTFSVLYNPALMATKTSICVFYLTLAETRPVFKWFTVGTIVVVNAAGLALSLLNIFQCRPMTALFSNPAEEAHQCTDIITLYLSSAPVNIITDLIILLLPMPLLKGMNLPRKQKIILYITFGFGIFVTAVDVVRIAYLQQATLNRLVQGARMHQGEKTDTQTATDFSWYASLSFMWSAIEVNVGIMCACVPSLKPLVSRFMPKMLRDASEVTPNKMMSEAAVDFNEMAAVQRVPSMPINTYSMSNPEAAEDESHEEEMSFADFLSAPDMSEFPRVQRTQTAVTDMAGITRQGTNFMDFMDMSDQKSIVFMSNRESIRPIVHVTVLFFLWGFAYGLLNTLNGQFEIVANMSANQSIALHSAYYAGYFLGPLTIGRLILKRWGFKACYMVGLMIYGTGTLVFWPSAVLTSFAAFFISNLIVGYGLSILEVAANPFIALCGPPQYAEVRLQLSQAIQACGTVVSPLLAKKALFKNVKDPSSLIDVQWTYLAITLFTFLLAFVYYCVKLPEVTDRDLEESARRTHPDSLDMLRSKKIIWITLGAAIVAQFCYVGAQETISTSLSEYLTAVDRAVDAVNFEAVVHSLFAASRFLAAFLSIFIAPRYLLTVDITGIIVFSALSMQFSGLTSVAMVACVYFFEGPLFSYIFALPLHGLGKYTKDGSVLLTAAISGGAVWPPIQYAVAKGHGYQYAYCVVVAALSTAALLPLWLNFSPDARKQIEPRHRSNTESPIGSSSALEKVETSSPTSSGGVFKRWNKGRSSDTDEAPSFVHLENFHTLPK